ncbi:MAG: ribbon-helix-helix domain-containing protein [Gammaproteobacteria bacterium]
MNVNVYIDESLNNRLSLLIKESGKTRNAIIRDALKDWVERHEHRQWSSAILKFKGIKNAPRFEEHRAELLPLKEDPLA